MSAPSRRPEILTVAGPVSVEQVDVVLPHEHAFVRLWNAPGRFDGIHQEDDPELLADELRSLAELEQGRVCIVDLTTPDLGREPERIRALAEASNVAVVMGCGWYREPYYRPEDRIDRLSTGQLADALIGEILNGVDGVRPGAIGEIGVDKDYLTAQEERAHRAAARAQRRTGLGLATHSLFNDVGLAQLDLFEEEGVDLDRVAVGHVDRYPYERYALEVARRGAYLMFDNIGDQTPGYEARVIRLLKVLLDAGFEHQVLVSQDICKANQLRANGGLGYGYIAEMFVPTLRNAGLSDGEIHRLRRDNPLSWLTGSRVSPQSSPRS